MKKICFFILVLCLVFSMSACGNEKNIQNAGNDGFCVECGGGISATDKFCGSCGVPINRKNNATTDVGATAHTHSFSNATCTAPAKCSCGATNGSALGHNYSNATCTSAKKCSRCGITSGSALGHSYSEGVCSRCGAKDSNYVKTYSIGETWVVDEQWELTIHSAKKHYLCNKYSDNDNAAECVIVTYSYKNLGYTGKSQDLFISEWSFDITGLFSKSTFSTIEGGSSIGFFS